MFKYLLYSIINIFIILLTYNSTFLNQSIKDILIYILTCLSIVNLIIFIIKFIIYSFKNLCCLIYEMIITLILIILFLILFI